MRVANHTPDHITIVVVSPSFLPISSSLLSLLLFLFLFFSLFLVVLSPLRLDGLYISHISLKQKLSRSVWQAVVILLCIYDQVSRCASFSFIYNSMDRNVLHVLLRVACLSAASFFVPQAAAVAAYCKQCCNGCWL